MDTPQIRLSISNAVTDAMNKIGADLGLPSLHWDVGARGVETAGIVGHMGKGHSSDPAEWLRAAEQWAQALGLTDKDATSWGTNEWTGVVDGVSIRVWATVDEARFYGNPAAETVEVTP
jgi:hypothetical protein